MENRIFHPIHDYEAGVFNTYSGKLIDILNPTPEMIDINDIANSLSKICRFGGHIKDDAFYSVAQHSVLVSKMAPSELRHAGLLHDAAEAYIGDIIKPWKNIIGPAVDIVERRFMDVIAMRFGVALNGFAAIKHWDRLALEIEHEYLQRDVDTRWREIVISYDLPGGPLWPPAARRLFLDHFKLYFL